MVILVAGASHTGKTLLAQRMLEEYRCPYLSIDHLKIEITIWGQSLFGYYSESAGRWLVNGNNHKGTVPKWLQGESQAYGSCERILQRRKAQDHRSKGPHPKVSGRHVFPLNVESSERLFEILSELSFVGHPPGCLTQDSLCACQSSSTQPRSRISSAASRPT